MEGDARAPRPVARHANIELWRDAGPRWELKDVKAERIDDSNARITVQAALPGVGATYSMVYGIHADGEISVECDYQPGSEKVAMMPRFGTELVVAPGLENLKWYGRGPQETMIDRQFERIGVYHGTVDQQWVDYMRPQENGNKTDVRWVKLTNAAGVGIRATGASGAERHRAALHQGRHRAGRLHVPDEAAPGDVPESGREADGRRRHRQLVAECVSDGTIPDLR